MIKEFYKGFKSGMKSFGNTLTIIINSILLSIVYLIGVGLTSIMAKILKKRFISLDLSNKKSYWSELNLKDKPLEEYYRQF